VRNATTDYLVGEDAIGHWLEDDCIVIEGIWTSSAALFSDYRTWCERIGERQMSAKRLTQVLEARGFVQKRTSSARGFSGIGLRQEMTRMTDGPVIPVMSAGGRPI
jgi:putative DNA primase/helicase